MDFKSRDKILPRLLKWGRPVTTRMFAIGSELTDQQRKAIMGILHWIGSPEQESVLKWTPVPGKLKVALCLPYALGFACDEQKVSSSLVDLHKPILIVVTSKHCLSHLEKHLSTNPIDGVQPYLQANGFLSTEEINEGAYYRTYLVRNITEAKKVTTAAKECDIVLADIQYCYAIPSHCFSIVFVYGNHELTMEQHYHIKIKFTENTKVVLFTTPPLVDQYDEHASEKSLEDPQNPDFVQNKQHAIIPKLVKYADAITKTDRIKALLNKRQLSVLYKVVEQVRDKEYKNFPVVVSMETGKGELEILCFLPYFLGKKALNYDTEPNDIDLTKPILIITTSSESLTLLKKLLSDKPYLVESGYLEHEELAEGALYKTHVVEDSFDAVTISKMSGNHEIILTAKGYYQSFPDDCFSVVVVFESNLLNRKVEKDIILKFDNTKTILFRVASHEPANMFAAEVKSRLEYLQQDEHAKSMSKLVKYGRSVKEKLLFASSSVLSEQQQLGLRALVDWFVYPDSKHEPALIDTTIGYDQAGVMVCCLPYMLGWAVSTKLITPEEMNLNKPILMLCRSVDTVNQIWDLVHVNPFFIKCSLLSSTDALTGALYSSYLVNDPISAVDIYNIVGLNEIVVSPIEYLEHLPEDCFSAVVTYTFGTFEEELQKRTIKKFDKHSKLIFINVHPEIHQNEMSMPDGYPSISALLKFGGIIKSERLLGKESRLTKQEQNGLQAVVEWFSHPDTKHLPMMLNEASSSAPDNMIVSCLPYMLGWAVDAKVIPAEEMDLNSKRILVLASDSIALGNLKSILFYPYLVKRGILDPTQVQAGAYYRAKILSDQDISSIASIADRYDILVADIKHHYLIPGDFFTIILVYSSYIFDPSKQMEVTQKFADSAKAIFIRASLTVEKSNYDQFIPRIELQPTPEVKNTTKTKDKLVKTLSPFFMPKKKSKSFSDKSQPWPDDKVLLGQGIVEKHSKFTIRKLERFHGQPGGTMVVNSKQKESHNIKKTAKANKPSMEKAKTNQAQPSTLHLINHICECDRQLVAPTLSLHEPTSPDRQLVAPTLSLHQPTSPSQLSQHGIKQRLSLTAKSSTNYCPQSNLQNITQSGAVSLLAMGICSKCMQSLSSQKSSEHTKATHTAHRMKKHKHDSSSNMHKINKIAKSSTIDSTEHNSVSKSKRENEKTNKKKVTPLKVSSMTKERLAGAVKDTQSRKITRTYYTKKLKVSQNSKGMQTRIGEVTLKPRMYRRYDPKYSREVQKGKKLNIPEKWKQSATGRHLGVKKLDQQSLQTSGMQQIRVNPNDIGQMFEMQRSSSVEHTTVLDNGQLHEGEQITLEDKMVGLDFAEKGEQTSNGMQKPPSIDEHAAAIDHEQQLQEDEQITLEDKMVGLDTAEKGEQTSYNMQTSPSIDDHAADVDNRQQLQKDEQITLENKMMGLDITEKGNEMQKCAGIDEHCSAIDDEQQQKEKEVLREIGMDLAEREQAQDEMQKSFSDDHATAPTDKQLQDEMQKSAGIDEHASSIDDEQQQKEKEVLHEVGMDLAERQSQDKMQKSFSDDHATAPTDKQLQDEMQKSAGIDEHASAIDDEQQQKEKEVLHEIGMDLAEREQAQDEVQKSFSDDHATASTDKQLQDTKEGQDINGNESLSRVEEEALKFKNTDKSATEENNSQQENESSYAQIDSTDKKSSLLLLMKEQEKIDSNNDKMEEIIVEKNQKHGLAAEKDERLEDIQTVFTEKSFLHIGHTKEMENGGEKSDKGGSEITKTACTEKNIAESTHTKLKVEVNGHQIESGKNTKSQFWQRKKKREKKIARDQKSPNTGKHSDNLQKESSDTVLNSLANFLCWSNKDKKRKSRDKQKKKIIKDKLKESVNRDDHVEESSNTQQHEINLEEGELEDKLEECVDRGDDVKESSNTQEREINLEKGEVEDTLEESVNREDHAEEPSNTQEHEINLEEGEVEDNLEESVNREDFVEEPTNTQEHEITLEEGELEDKLEESVDRGDDVKESSNTQEREINLEECEVEDKLEESVNREDFVEEPTNTQEHEITLEEGELEDKLEESVDRGDHAEEPSHKQELETNNLEEGELEQQAEQQIQDSSETGEIFAEIDEAQQPKQSIDVKIQTPFHWLHRHKTEKVEVDRKKTVLVPKSVSVGEYYAAKQQTEAVDDQMKSQQKKFPIWHRMESDLNKVKRKQPEMPIPPSSGEHATDAAGVYYAAKQQTEVVDDQMKSQQKKFPIWHRMESDLNKVERKQPEMSIPSTSGEHTTDAAESVSKQDRKEEETDDKAQKLNSTKDHNLEENYEHHKQEGAEDAWDDDYQQLVTAVGEQLTEVSNELKTSSAYQLGRSRFAVLRQRLKRTMSVDKQTSTEIEGAMDKPFLLELLQENQEQFKTSPENTLKILLYHALAEDQYDYECRKFSHKFYSGSELRSSSIHLLAIEREILEDRAISKDSHSQKNRELKAIPKQEIVKSEPDITNQDDEEKTSNDNDWHSPASTVSYKSLKSEHSDTFAQQPLEVSSAEVHGHKYLTNQIPSQDRQQEIRRMGEHAEVSEHGQEESAEDSNWFQTHKEQAKANNSQEMLLGATEQNSLENTSECCPLEYTGETYVLKDIKEIFTPDQNLEEISEKYLEQGHKSLEDNSEKYPHKDISEQIILDYSCGCNLLIDSIQSNKTEESRRQDKVKDSSKKTQMEDAGKENTFEVSSRQSLLEDSGGVKSLKDIKEELLEDISVNNTMEDIAGINSLKDISNQNLLEDASGQNSLEDIKEKPLEDCEQNLLGDTSGQKSLEDTSGRKSLEDITGQNKLQENINKEKPLENSEHDLLGDTSGQNSLEDTIGQKQLEVINENHLSEYNSKQNSMEDTSGQKLMESTSKQDINECNSSETTSEQNLLEDTSKQNPLENVNKETPLEDKQKMLGDSSGQNLLEDTSGQKQLEVANEGHLSEYDSKQNSMEDTSGPKIMENTSKQGISEHNPLEIPRLEDTSEQNSLKNINKEKPLEDSEHNLLGDTSGQNSSEDTSGKKQLEVTNEDHLSDYNSKQNSLENTSGLKLMENTSKQDNSEHSPLETTSEHNLLEYTSKHNTLENINKEKPLEDKQILLGDTSEQNLLENTSGQKQLEVANEDHLSEYNSKQNSLEDTSGQKLMENTSKQDISEHSLLENTRLEDTSEQNVLENINKENPLEDSEHNLLGDTIRQNSLEDTGGQKQLEVTHEDHLSEYNSKQNSMEDTSGQKNTSKQCNSEHNPLETTSEHNLLEDISKQNPLENINKETPLEEVEQNLLGDTSGQNSSEDTSGQKQLEVTHEDHLSEYNSKHSSEDTRGQKLMENAGEQGNNECNPLEPTGKQLLEDTSEQGTTGLNPLEDTGGQNLLDDSSGKKSLDDISGQYPLVDTGRQDSVEGNSIKKISERNC